jgi:hypothetical protein
MISRIIKNILNEGFIVEDKQNNNKYLLKKVHFKLSLKSQARQQFLTQRKREKELSQSKS